MPVETKDRLGKLKDLLFRLELINRQILDCRSRKLKDKEMLLEQKSKTLEQLQSLMLGAHHDKNAEA